MPPLAKPICALGVLSLLVTTLAYFTTTVPEVAGQRRMVMVAGLLAAVVAFGVTIATYLAADHTWFGRAVHSTSAATWTWRLALLLFVVIYFGAVV